MENEVHSDDEEESISSTGYLLSDFASLEDLKRLKSMKPDARIFGLPSLYAMHFQKKVWTKSRPLFSFAMEGAIVSVTGFRDPVFVVSSSTFTQFQVCR